MSAPAVPPSSVGVAAPDPAPGLIVTDLDGTFLSSDGTVSRENSDAVLAAQQAGVPVLFATGRPVRWLDVVRDLPGGHPTVIASNGAVLYDLGAQQLLDRICIEPDVALAAVSALRRALPGTVFGFESGTRFGYEPAYRTAAVADPANPALFTGSAEELAGSGDAVKMLVQNARMGSDELVERVRGVLQDSLTVTHSAGRSSGLVEVSAPGVSKASMLQRVCRTLGLRAADVAAFGDMPNDLDMLGWVGMPHVVANAHPQLLDVGFTVVGANDDSGVGRAIQQLLARPRASGTR